MFTAISYKLLSYMITFPQLYQTGPLYLLVSSLYKRMLFDHWQPPSNNNKITLLVLRILHVLLVLYLFVSYDWWLLICVTSPYALFIINIFELLLWSKRFAFFYHWFLQIPELDFEIPPEAQRGSLSTVSPFIHYY